MKTLTMFFAIITSIVVCGVYTGCGGGGGGSTETPTDLPSDTVGGGGGGGGGEETPSIPVAVADAAKAASEATLVNIAKVVLGAYGFGVADEGAGSSSKVDIPHVYKISNDYRFDTGEPCSSHTECKAHLVCTGGTCQNIHGCEYYNEDSCERAVEVGEYCVCDDRDGSGKGCCKEQCYGVSCEYALGVASMKSAFDPSLYGDNASLYDAACDFGNEWNGLTNRLNGSDYCDDASGNCAQVPVAALAGVDCAYPLNILQDGINASFICGHGCGSVSFKGKTDLLPSLCFDHKVFGNVEYNGCVMIDLLEIYIDYLRISLSTDLLGTGIDPLTITYLDGTTLTSLSKAATAADSLIVQFMYGDVVYHMVDGLFYIESVRLEHAYLWWGESDVIYGPIPPAGQQGTCGIDCLSTWCQSQLGECDAYGCCAFVEYCDNGIDDDGDGMIDCLDTDCNWLTICKENERHCGTPEEECCSDGLDNDSDDWVDCADPDCAIFCVEIGCGGTKAVCCSDGQDSDADGLTDCADPDCAGIGSCPL